MLRIAQRQAEDAQHVASDPRPWATQIRLIEHAIEAHDARVTDLLGANTREVERRRAVEAELAITERLLEERDAVLREFPCPAHGPCIPYLRSIANAGTWRPTVYAPKDEPVLLKFLDPIPGRPDMEHFGGLTIVGRRHPGDPNWGWNLAGPFGMGGFADAWFVGWMPLPGAHE